MQIKTELNTFQIFSAHTEEQYKLKLARILPLNFLEVDIRSNQKHRLTNAICQWSVSVLGTVHSFRCSKQSMSEKCLVLTSFNTCLTVAVTNTWHWTKKRQLVTQDTQILEGGHLTGYDSCICRALQNYVPYMTAYFGKQLKIWYIDESGRYILYNWEHKNII